MVPWKGQLLGGIVCGGRAGRDSGGVMLVGMSSRHSVGKGWNPGPGGEDALERVGVSLASRGWEPRGKDTDSPHAGGGDPDPPSSEGTTDW